MFRETYKNAVNEVEINNALKESLLIKAQNIPQKKPKAVSRYVYKASAFAAAAAVAVFSVYTVSKTDIFSPGKNMTADIPVVNTETVTEPETDKPEPEVVNEPPAMADDLQKKAYSEPEVKNEADVKTATEEETGGVHFDTAATADTADILVKEEAVSEKVQTEEAASETKELQNEKASSGGGSTVKSEEVETAATARAAAFGLNDAEEWTMEEYYSYLGVNVEEALSVPQDMENTTGRILYISEDNDACCFSYKGDGERFINVSTSKNTETAYELLNSEEMTKEEHDGQAWAVTNSEDGYFSAVTVKEEISFYVDAKDLTDEEEKNLIKSISSINCN